MSVCQGHRLDLSWSGECSLCRINPGRSSRAQGLDSSAAQVAALLLSHTLEWSVDLLHGQPNPDAWPKPSGVVFFHIYVGQDGVHVCSGVQLEANEDKQTDVAARRGKTTAASPALLITSSSALRIEEMHTNVDTHSLNHSSHTRLRLWLSEHSSSVQSNWVLGLNQL